MAERTELDNRKAAAALLLCFVVGAMILTLVHPDLGNGRVGRPPSQTGSGLAVDCPAPVVIQPPRPDLAVVVDQHPAGTCFLLEPGTYRFHDVVPKDGMTFIGTSTASVVVDGDGYENAFHGTSDGVTIAQVTFTNFNSSAGTSRQEQAPIRGTAALWASSPGQLATNWLVTDVVSYGNYASGIFIGDHWTVVNSVFHTNGVTGIGGNGLVGGLIEANIVHNNGAYQAQGAAMNGGGIKLTQSGTPNNPVVVESNELYDNETIAIWCDIGCDGFHVIDNYIHDHSSQGIMYELSSNLVARGNTILRSNTWTNFSGDFNAGAITMGESRNGLIENNLIDQAEAGAVIRQTSRPKPDESFLYGYPYINLISREIVVRNNVISNTDMMGISTGTSGSGQITQPETILFEGNSYGSPGGMTFWWNNGQQQSFADWQAAGRDVTAAGSQSSSPTTQTRGPRGLTFQPTSVTTTAVPTTAVPTTAVPTTVPGATAAPTTTTATTSTATTSTAPASTTAASTMLTPGTGTISARPGSQPAGGTTVGGGQFKRPVRPDPLGRGQRYGVESQPEGDDQRSGGGLPRRPDELPFVDSEGPGDDGAGTIAAVGLISVVGAPSLLLLVRQLRRSLLG